MIDIEALARLFRDIKLKFLPTFGYKKVERQWELLDQRGREICIAEMDALIRFVVASNDLPSPAELASTYHAIQQSVVAKMGCRMTERAWHDCADEYQQLTTAVMAEFSDTLRELRRA
jgi:hypothetical protein